MKLDQRLNLVIPIEQGGRTYHVHCTPISMEMFDAHFRLIARTNTEIFGGGYGALSGPRIAAKLMREASINLETIAMPGRPVQAGRGDGFNAIMTEIRRLTMVIGAPGGPILLEDAVGKGVVDALDRDILENALVFFTVVSVMEDPRESARMMDVACSLWSGQMTSSNSTAFADSLRTSTATESTGEKAAVGSSAAY